MQTNECSRDDLAVLTVLGRIVRHWPIDTLDRCTTGGRAEHTLRGLERRGLVTVHRAPAIGDEPGRMYEAKITDDGARTLVESIHGA